VLDHRGHRYDAVRGEGAFYGPKVDVQILDPLGREFTLSTVQVDLYQPVRFDLGYLQADQTVHRPVMIHRSIIGSLERLVAHLIEVYAGAFPVWLAPVQLVVLPVTEDQVPPAVALAQRGIQAVCAPRSASLTGAVLLRGSGLIGWCPTRPSSAPAKPTTTSFPCACAPAITSTAFPSSRRYATSPPPPPNAVATYRR
jgi:tRNA synthetase class II core domain (G, H, P, S and T)